jgi:hypothetical protein
MNDTSSLLNGNNMEIVNIPKWHIVYTRPLMEKKLMTRFSQKNIEHYCPMKAIKHLSSSRQKSMPVPLFTSYVFVRVTPDKHPLIKKMWEVINLVHWLDKPIIIENAEIDMLRKFLKMCNEVTIEKIPVSKSSMATLKYNHLLPEKKNTQEVNSYVKLQWPSIGYELKAGVNQQFATATDTTRDDQYQQPFLTKFAI